MNPYEVDITWSVKLQHFDITFPAFPSVCSIAAMVDDIEPMAAEALTVWFDEVVSIEHIAVNWPEQEARLTYREAWRLSERFEDADQFDPSHFEVLEHGDLRRTAMIERAISFGTAPKTAEAASYWVLRKDPTTPSLLDVDES